MTLREYQLRMEAYQLKKVDRQEELAIQAFFNQQIKATTGSAKHPKPKYPHLKDLFDREEEVAKIVEKYEGVKRPIKPGDIFAKRVAEWQKKKAARAKARKE